MTQRNRVDYLDDSDCHSFSGDPQKYLFSSPSEICHWNSTVLDSYSSPESSGDSESSSQFAESNQDCLSTYSMEHSTYRKSSGSRQWSSDALSDQATDPFSTGLWLDSQLPGNAPFSPVFSDFTVPTSETSFASLDPPSHELHMTDPFTSSNWSAELTDRSYMDEPAISEQSLFPLPDHTQPEAIHAGYQSWFSPSEVNFEHYFQMDASQQHVPAFSTMAPQTAGFVGSAPMVSNPQASQSYQSMARVGRSYESASTAPVRGQYEAGIGSHAGATRGSFVQPDQSPELSKLRQPRRLSVSVNTPLVWSPSDVRDPPGFGSHLDSVPILESHRSSNASVVGSTTSRVPSIAGSVVQAMNERPLSSSSPARDRSEDSEGKPRSHRYYTTARPHADGYYHCPYVQTEKCPHKPTKLKCNYDKYIDSHLKPFVCKQEGCKGVDNENRFSSTACLLRHEREAHGLHGHGNKPYLCKYDGCERSLPGNGFPRNYNLMDHMKRVHRHHPEQKTPSTPDSSTGKRGTKTDTHKVRKRKPEAPKRTHTGSGSVSSRSNNTHLASPAPTLPGQEWADIYACKDKLQQQLRRMEDHNPREAATQIQYLKQEIFQGYP